MKNKNLLGTLELLLSAFIWGSAFVAQSAGMDHVGPFTFQAVRFILGGIVLLPVIMARDATLRKKGAQTKSPDGNKKLIISGVICGLFLTVAASFQQVGIVYTSAGKAGFITALYVIFVPLCSIFTKKMPSVNVWLAVAGATVGLYLLCMNGGFSLSLGDSLIFICSICYTAHIIAIDKVSADVDPIKLSCIQFFTVGILSVVPMFIFETPDMSSILSAWLPIIYTGVLSSGVAYTLQAVAQRHTQPTIAAITMSFESVFAVLAGSVVLSETLKSREIAGCIIMFTAIILAQLPGRFFTFKRK